MELESYKSFLVRLWCDPRGHNRRDGWRAEVEHIQTGTRWSFSAPGDLLAFLEAVFARDVETPDT